jgi:hypothetical protein
MTLAEGSGSLTTVVTSPQNRKTAGMSKTIRVYWRLGTDLS